MEVLVSDTNDSSLLFEGSCLFCCCVKLLKLRLLLLLVWICCRALVDAALVLGEFGCSNGDLSKREAS